MLKNSLHLTVLVRVQFFEDNRHQVTSISSILLKQPILIGRNCLWLLPATRFVYCLQGQEFFLVQTQNGQRTVRSHLLNRIADCTFSSPSEESWGETRQSFLNLRIGSSCHGNSVAESETGTGTGQRRSTWLASEWRLRVQVCPVEACLLYLKRERERLNTGGEDWTRERLREGERGWEGLCFQTKAKPERPGLEKACAVYLNEPERKWGSLDGRSFLSC